MNRLPSQRHRRALVSLTLVNWTTATSRTCCRSWSRAVALQTRFFWSPLIMANLMTLKTIPATPQVATHLGVSSEVVKVRSWKLSERSVGDPFPQRGRHRTVLNKWPGTEKRATVNQATQCFGMNASMRFLTPFTTSPRNLTSCQARWNFAVAHRFLQSFHNQHSNLLANGTRNGTL